MPSFSAIARAAGSEQRWRADLAEGEALSERPHPSESGPSATEAEEPDWRDGGPLPLSFARYPRHGADGFIDWTTALIACQGFMAPEAFEAAKRHRKTSRDASNGRQESLYGLNMLRDLVSAGILFKLDGQAPAERFLKIEGERRRFDAENFALSVMAKSDFAPVANIPALVRAKFYRDKLAALTQGAAREPAADAVSSDWIQLSPGPARPDAIMIEPKLSLMRWTPAGSTAPAFARLSSPEDAVKLARLGEHFAQAIAACSAPDPSPDGIVAPGVPAPRAPERARALNPGASR